MGPSRRPLADHAGSTWLGHPLAPVFRIEVTDDALVFHAPSGITRVAWSRIRSLDVDIPTASWRRARMSQRVLSTMDNLQVGTSDGVTIGSDLRFGRKDIEVRVILDDGTEVVGWAQKHQPLGYPAPEAAAAVAVLRGRVGRSGL